MLWSLAGNIASVGLWVVATDFRTFLASRMVGGLSEGNVQLANAMAADISNEKERGSTMALVGACFSIAFTFGPALGAALANIETFAANPFATAAGFSLLLIVVETVYIYTSLPETLPSSQISAKSKDARSTGQVPKAQQISRTNSHTILNFTHFIFLLFFSGMEFSLPFMTYDLFSFTSAQTGKLLGFMGFVAAILQGSVTRRVHPLKVIQAGVMACTAAFFILSRLTTTTQLWGAASLLAVTTATVVTGLNSLSSLEAEADIRGGKLGAHRSWGETAPPLLANTHNYCTDFDPGQLGRSMGPLLFCTLYWWAGREVAYSVGGAGMLGVCGLIFRTLKAPVQSLTVDTKNN